jgi:uncharacterized protein YecT (DUF1311 family)
MAISMGLAGSRPLPDTPSRRTRAGCRGLVVLVVAVVVAACSGTAAAAAGQDGPAPCDGAVTTLEMNACYARAVDDRTTALDALVAKIRDHLDAPRLSAFLASQRDWTAFLQSHCGVVAAPYEGGSAETVVRRACLFDLTRARVDQLGGLYAEWTSR